MYRHRKSIPSAETVFHNRRISKQFEGLDRFDGLNHLIVFDEKKSRSALCGKTSKRKCTKYDIKLHDFCF